MVCFIKAQNVHGYQKINVFQKTVSILPIWFIWTLCSYSSVYQRSFIMTQDYFVRLVLALSTNTLCTNSLYEGATIIHFIVNRAYHFFFITITLWNRQQKASTLFCYHLKLHFQRIMVVKSIAFDIVLLPFNFNSWYA